MAKNPKRIPEEKVFITRELSQGVTILKTAKVLQRDHWKIKRHLTTSQQIHKKRVQSQLYEVKRSSIEVNSSTSCKNPTSFKQTDF